MPLNLPSDREEFSAFPAFFEDEIAPYLRAKEDARQNGVLHAGLIVIGVAVTAFAAYRFAPFGEANFHIAFVIGMIGFAAAAWRLNRTRDEITHGLLERICGKLGYVYGRTLARPDYYHVFDRLKLLPGFNRERWEDEVRGARHGAAFVLCEAHLKYKSSGKNSSTRTVFHGQLLVIDYPKRFLGETVVRRDRGMLNRLGKPGKAFQQVGIASPKFEKIFEAWSTDQVEARELLDPVVLERFEELDRLFSGAKFRAAFSDGKLYVALETGDKLNMGSMFKPLEGPARVEMILKEFDLIYDLIDVALKPVDGRLDGTFNVTQIR